MKAHVTSRLVSSSPERVGSQVDFKTSADIKKLIGSNASGSLHCKEVLVATS
jgi:hypothetical protein